MGAARYKPYPAYKPSGVEWLGDIPEGWELKPCRSVVDHHANKNSNGQSENYLSLMANVGVIPYAEKGDVGNKKPDDLSKCKIVRKGDLVINSMNYAIGSYGMSAYDGICSPVYIILSAQSENLLDRFALRVFENKPFQKHLAVFGNGILEHRAAIGWDTIKGQYVPVPPIQEQDTILKFLDYETGKIDALIAKQERLIALLEEKRQAVISHAVTKGLDPTASLRPSGIDWLGDVPEYWEVSRIKHLATIISKGTTPSTLGGELVDKGIRFLKAENIGKSTLVALNPEFFITPKVDDLLFRSRLEKSDVLVIIAGATTGLASVVQEDVLPANTNQAVSFVRPKDPIFAHFILNWLKTDFAQRNIWVGAVQAAQPNLSMEDLGNIPIALPPQEEIASILDEVKSQDDTFAGLLAKAQTAITLLKERRTALISAAVTGKIDVRDWQPPQPQSDTDLSTETLQEAAL